MPLIRRTNVITETDRAQTTVDMLYEGRERNAVFRASKAGARSAHRTEFQVHKGDRWDLHAFLKDAATNLPLLFC